MRAASGIVLVSDFFGANESYRRVAAPAPRRVTAVGLVARDGHPVDEHGPGPNSAAQVRVRADDRVLHRGCLLPCIRGANRAGIECAAGGSGEVED